MSGKTTITALDSATPVTGFNIGDQANSALRVNVVAGGGGGGGNVNLIQVGGAAIAIGQAAMAASLPVVIASNQSAITVAQATGTNLHTVVDSGSITATQATGTNLHVVVDSGAVTVTGTVSGTGTAGTAATGVLTVQGIAAMLPVSTTVTSVLGSAVAATTANTGTSSSNASVTLTFTSAGGSLCHVISGVAWSYDGTSAPTTGAISVTDNGSTVFTVAITQTGAGFIPFNPPLRGTAATAMTIVLAAAGVASVGKVNVLGHWTAQ